MDIPQAVEESAVFNHSKKCFQRSGDFRSKTRIFCAAVNLLKSQALIKKSYRQKKSIAKQRRQNGTLGRLK